VRYVLRLALALLVVPIAIACNVPFIPEKGSGNMATESRDVSGFDQVSLDGVGTLTIEQGDHEALTIEAEDNILPLIRTEVRNGRLEIGIRRGTSIQPTREIRYHLTMRDIHAIEVEGSADVESAGIQTDALTLRLAGSTDARIDRFAGDRLTVRISGSGTCSIAGDVTDQRVEIEGSGEYSAAHLASETAAVDVAGSGDATVRVAQTLTVSIAGSGDVQYYGNPSINQRILGSGRVERADE